MYMTRGLGLLTLTVGVATLLLGSGAALAADSPQGAAPVAVSATAVPGQDGHVTVSVQLATAQGQVLSGQEVTFFLEVNFMGRSRVPVGSATTDAFGWAQVDYVPTWEGTQRMVARLAGSAGSPAAETTILFDVADIASTYIPEPPALGRLREWTPIIVGVVVILVWATMALVLVRTVYGIVVAGRQKGLSGGYRARADVFAAQRQRR